MTIKTIDYRRSTIKVSLSAFQQEPSEASKHNMGCMQKIREPVLETQEFTD